MPHPFRKAPQLPLRGTVMYHFQPILPVSSLYDYLERHQFPRERMNMTDITIKFRGNV